MSRNIFIRPLAISQASGGEVDINLVLPQKPIREQQKLQTLTKYVEQYPTGWKKRLELADLLYGMGKWTKAVEQYYEVIERQPQLITVQLKLAKILQLMGRETEAIKVYERTLSFLSNLQFSSPTSSNITQSYLASQSHIIGLMEVCRHNFLLAIESFQKAVTLEPNNSSHWLALGQVYNARGNHQDALKTFQTIISHHPDDLIALINIYDTLIALGNEPTQLLSQQDYFEQEKNEKRESQPLNSIDNLWHKQAERILNQLITLAPNNYLVIKRQIKHRCRLKLVSGVEGKQTKKLIKTVIKLSPNRVTASQLKTYYSQIKG